MKMRAVVPQDPFPATLSFAKTPAARQASWCNNSYADPLARERGLGFELPSEINVIGRNGRKLESGSVLEVAVNVLRGKGKWLPGARFELATHRFATEC